MIFENWGEVTYQALYGLWTGFVNFIPALIGAILVFIMGWFIAIWGGKIVTEVLKRIKVNELFQRGNWDEALAKADIKVDAAGFIGAIVKWILVLVFLVATANILRLEQFSDLLQGILAYLPNVLVAALIFVVTVIVADIVEKVVRVSVERINVGYGHMISAIIKWAIWIFAIVTILEQLNIGGGVPQIVIQGVVGFFALAGGLAFGLGGKDAAAKFIEEMKGKMKK
ncbi:hypothetical protein ACFLYY_02275 [Patescibacteria group bacterium]